jgi:hypothetical protein
MKYGSKWYDILVVFALILNSIVIFAMLIYWTR